MAPLVARRAGLSEWGLDCRASDFLQLSSDDHRAKRCGNFVIHDGRGGRVRREGSLTVRTLDAPFGVEVQGVSWEPPDPTTVAALTRLLRRHLLMVFRGQASPSREQLDGFFRPFGRLVLETVDGRYHYGLFDDDRRHQVYRAGGHNYVESPEAGAAELRWHHDHTYLPQLKTISGLEAIECDDQSVPTTFRDMYTACELLPAPLRTPLIEKMGVYFDPRLPGPDERSRLCDATHPVLTTHPDSGRTVLYICDLTARLVGFEESEGEDLLEALRRHALDTAPLYCHSWTEGDFVFWDNVGLQHRRQAMPPGHRRRLRVFEGVAE